MTVLDIDPPPALRLVSTDGLTSARDHRYRSGAVLHGPARILYREVLEAALVSGAQINPDALRVVLATKQATNPAPIRQFTGSGLWHLMFIDVVSWCRARKLDVPQSCPRALAAVVAYLDATSGFADRSDPVDELYDAIDECTGGWCDTHPSSPTSSRRSLRSDRGPKRT